MKRWLRLYVGLLAGYVLSVEVVTFLAAAHWVAWDDLLVGALLIPVLQSFVSLLFFRSSRRADR